MLLARHMPRSVKIKSSKKNQEMGAMSLSFSSIDEDTFYVGAESGGMFKCSITRETEIGNVSVCIYSGCTIRVKGFYLVIPEGLAEKQFRV